PVQDLAFRQFYQVLIGIAYELMVEPHIPQGEPELTITFNLSANVVGDGTVINRFYRYPDNPNFYSVLQNDETESRFLVARQNVNSVWRLMDDLLEGNLDRRR
ncbi:MAG: hypothetical protein FWD01_03510, partial [Defluviitaleaceae bacterium]|nr:hypothetical protein [Defluviitaleaceae bacterium]